MNWTEQINHARAQGDWSEVIQAVPFARFLDLRIDVKGEEFTCVLPFQEKLIGNPILPALHGGATGGFLECAGLFYLLWHMDSQDLPKTIDFNIDYLRAFDLVWFQFCKRICYHSCYWYFDKHVFRHYYNACVVEVYYTLV